MQLADDGTPLMVVMAWNENNAYWAAVRYDTAGNILYTINNGIPNDNSKQIKGKAAVSLNNYPNPFNPTTVIRYSLIENGFTSLKIYNSLGEEVASLVNEKQNAGTYEVNFDGTNLSSGVYYYRMVVNGVMMETKRMMLVK